MSKLKDLIKKIGSLFTGLFDASEKAFKKTDPEFQQAIIRGSQIVAILNEHANETPEFVFEQIRKVFPRVSREKLTEILKDAAKGLHVAETLHDSDLTMTLLNLQQYLKGIKAAEGRTWAKVSGALAKGIAIFLAPKGTKWSAIESFAEFVYHEFVKK